MAAKRRTSRTSGATAATPATAHQGDEAAATLVAFPDLYGPWQLVRQLGSGSWTEVYQARPATCQADHPADYAVKIPRPDRRGDPLVEELLQREFQVGRTFTHAHVAPILSASVEQPPYYLALPLIVGSSLEHHLRRHQRLSPPVALWFVRQAAEGLSALHEHGWLHGDVKPGNLLVSASGHVTLIDLGFARELQQLASTEPPRTLAATPAYAAPEALDWRQPPQSASDTYSLGVTLFELLTGERPQPFTTIARDQQASRADVRDWLPYAPRSLARLLHQMLAVEPHERPTDTSLVEKLFELEIATFHLRERLAA
jgi:serine/threonine protein kinase